MARGNSFFSLKNLALATGGYAAWSIFRKSSSASALDYKIAGVQGLQLKGLGTVVSQVKVNFLNPSTQTYTLNSIFLKLQKGGQTFGTLNRTGALAIEPQGTTQGLFNFEASITDLARIVFGTLKDGKTEVNADGYIRFANLPEIAISQPVAYALPSWLTQALAALSGKKSKSSQ